MKLNRAEMDKIITEFVTVMSSHVQIAVYFKFGQLVSAFQLLHNHEAGPDHWKCIQCIHVHYSRGFDSSGHLIDMKQEMPGYSYPCLHNHNSIRFLIICLQLVILISHHLSHYEMVQRPGEGFYMPQYPSFYCNSVSRFLKAKMRSSCLHMQNITKTLKDIEWTHMMH